MEEIKAAHLILIEEACDTGIGEGKIEKVNRLTKGLADSTLYKVKAGGINYVVRIADPRAKRFIENEYRNMQQAAETGFAPELFYLNIETGIAVMAHIETKAFKIFDKNLEQFTKLIRKLHSKKTYEDKDNCYKHIERMYKNIHKYIQHPALEEAFQLYQSAKPILKELGRKTNTHGDLNPDNILFDGERFWLVDWATASVQSSYVDLACIMNFYFPQNEKLQQEFLDFYYEEQNNSLDATHIKMMQPISMIYYGFSFIYLCLLNSKSFKVDEPMYTLPHYGQFSTIIKMGYDENISSEEEIDFALVCIKEALEFSNISNW